MKTPIIALLACLCLWGQEAMIFKHKPSGPVGPASSVGYRISNGTTASSNLDTTGATLIVIVCVAYGGPCNAIGANFSDSAGNTYTFIGEDVATNNRTRMYYKCGPATSTTHHWTSASTDTIFVGVYSGTQTSSCYDAGTFNHNQLASTTVTPTLTHELIVTALGDNYAGTGRAASGLTTRLEYGASTSFMTGALADLLDYNSTSALTISWGSWPSVYGNIVAAFK